MPLEKLQWSLAFGFEQGGHLPPDEADAYRSIIEVVRRFESRTASELALAMKGVKPKSSKRGVPPRTLSAQATTFCARLEKANANPSETQRIVDEMVPLQKQEVIEIARRLGVRTNSKTTKTAALQGIATLAGRATREQDLAERIRRGA